MKREMLVRVSNDAIGDFVYIIYKKDNLDIFEIVFSEVECIELFNDSYNNLFSWKAINLLEILRCEMCEDNA